ncbi:MAG: hypothetical protein G01um101429_592 [Parcubacteria group bacterium Gr01-1014_29]|nr:MAG: hypothetical protein G01um101429_592 [Parcubacteria group bacterium Gr01-1014_29]
MDDLIKKINTLRNIPDSNLNLSVKKVAVILTSPRSGSSLVKSIFRTHPDIASLDGEIEPLLTLSRNGFGYNSDSDAIEILSNKNELANSILDGLTIPSQDLSPSEILKKRWEKRLLLQFPVVFSGTEEHAELVELLDSVLFEVKTLGIKEEKELQKLILTKIFRNSPWRMNYYDGYKVSDTKHFFNELKIEEPPFIVPRLYARSLTADDVENKTLLFKTPPDAYRIGVYEQIFPNAEIKYIHLTRGYAQSVNGLMDGWLSPIGFFSHNLKRAGVSLSIKGYSDSVEFGKSWWKFDMPPNWREFISADLENVCLNQWMSAHKAILESKLPKLSISFEQILLEPSETINRITDYLGLQELKSITLPVVMAIETPKARRWLKREDLLLKIGKQKIVSEMMDSLGYEMNPETWL